MSAPRKTHGLIEHVAGHALDEATELDDLAQKAESDAREFRRMADVLRTLHSIALPHARSTLEVMDGGKTA